MKDKLKPKVFKTMHWWVLTIFSVMDHQRIFYKDRDPEVAAKMQHLINEIGGRVGYAELKALDLKAMKLMQHMGAGPLTRWYWALRGKALDQQYERLKKRTWVLTHYEFTPVQWSLFFDMVYKCKGEFKTLWPDDERQLFIHLNDANSNFHERVIV